MLIDYTVMNNKGEGRERLNIRRENIAQVNFSSVYNIV